MFDRLAVDDADVTVFGRGALPVPGSRVDHEVGDDFASLVDVTGCTVDLDDLGFLRSEVPDDCRVLLGGGDELLEASIQFLWLENAVRRHGSLLSVRQRRTERKWEQRAEKNGDRGLKSGRRTAHRRCL